METNNSLRVRTDGGAVTFQALGEAKMMHALAMRRFAEQSLAGGAVDVRVDLSACTYMDSTFIGTLLFLQRAVGKRQAAHFALMAPSARCSQLLSEMGLQDVCTVVPEEEETDRTWCELQNDVKDSAAFKRTVVQAHEELAELPGRPGETFRQVVQCLKQNER